MHDPQGQVPVPARCKGLTSILPVTRERRNEHPAADAIYA